MPRSGLPLPVTKPEMAPAALPVTGVAGRSIARGSLEASPAETGSAEVWPAAASVLTLAGELADGSTDRKITRGRVLTWPAATVTGAAPPAQEAPPDHWSRYRPGAPQSL
jgi:hypothetical protein